MTFADGRARRRPDRPMAASPAATCMASSPATNSATPISPRSAPRAASGLAYEAWSMAFSTGWRSIARPISILPASWRRPVGAELNHGDHCDDRCLEQAGDQIEFEAAAKIGGASPRGGHRGSSSDPRRSRRHSAAGRPARRPGPPPAALPASPHWASGGVLHPAAWRDSWRPGCRRASATQRRRSAGRRCEPARGSADRRAAPQPSRRQDGAAIYGRSCCRRY